MKTTKKQFNHVIEDDGKYFGYYYSNKGIRVIEISKEEYDLNYKRIWNL